MKLFKRTGGCFQVVGQQRFADEHYERHLEEWIYHNPQLIAHDLMMIGRQVVTDGSKRIDLLALNSDGQTVIIELKRAESPRDLVGQINEYITAVGKWSERELEKRIGRQPRTLEKAFRETFRSEPPEEFNKHRDAVVVVEDIDPDTLETFRRQNIRVMTFSYLKSADEEYLVVNDLSRDMPIRCLGAGRQSRGNGGARRTRKTTGTGDSERTQPDVVVVAARNAWPEYQRYHAYVCQPDRPFKPVARMAFYAGGRIHRLIPLIFEAHEHIDFVPDKHKGRLGEVVSSLLKENKRKLGISYKVMLLSAPDSPDTLKLAHPIRNDLKSKAGKLTAFTQSQRYVSSAALASASKTSDLVDEGSDVASTRPRSGFWFVNVGEGPHRCWDDCVKYGFLSAGQGKVYSDAMKRLHVGDRVFAYMNGLGYVGFGVITQPAVMAKDFKVGDRYLFEVPLAQAGMRDNGDNAELSEWPVGVKWSRTYPRDQAKRFRGAFASRNVVCNLRDPDTLDFLKRKFGIEE